MLKLFLILALVLTVVNSLFSQEFYMEGTLKDSFEVSLAGANLIALPQSDALYVKFSITDHKGRYRLKLIKDSTYVLEVSYLGYKKITDTITATQDEIIKKKRLFFNI